MKNLFLILTLILVSGCSSAKKTGPVKAQSVGQYKLINGINIWYEVHNPDKDGVPLVILHGGGSNINVTYGRILPHLRQDRRVIALDEQGHGQTTDRETPVTFEQSAKDVVALLKELGITKADIMGFSNGASVALEIAIKNPEIVRSLIFASSITKRSGATKEFWSFINKATFEDMPQALKDEYLRGAPHKDKLRTMHDKDAERMRTFKDVPDKYVRTVVVPTLIMMGDKDIVRLEHAAELKKLFQNSTLVILPGFHGEYLGEMITGREGSKLPALSAGIISEFLNQFNVRN